MKVLVISHLYPSPCNTVAGIFVHEQVKAMARQGCEVRVISPVPWAPFPLNLMSAKWKSYSEVPLQLVYDGIQVYYPRFLALPRAILLASSGRRMHSGIEGLVGEICEDFPFDVIHAHVALPAGSAATKLKKAYDKPLVVTVHGHDLQVTLHRNARCRRALESVFRNADKVIAVSSKLRRIAEVETECHQGFTVIPNGIDPGEIAPARDIPNPADSGLTTILSVSNLVESKGIDLNLHALSKLTKKYSDLRYEVVGTGAEMKKLERLAADLDLTQHVRFLGRLPHDEVMRHFARADIFSLPSWREGFGIVYLEALAHGKPVIACKGEGIEDVVTGGETGLLVEPKDVESLVRALDFLLADPKRAQVMGERGRKLVMESYTWDKSAEKTIAVYRDALDPKRS